MCVSLSVCLFIRSIPPKKNEENVQNFQFSKSTACHLDLVKDWSLPNLKHPLKKSPYNNNDNNRFIVQVISNSEQDY